MMPAQPGSHLLAVARTVVDRHTMFRLVEPAVADLRHEYQEACKLPGSSPRRRALVRGYGALLRLLPAIVFGCGQRITSGFTREDDALMGRLLVTMALSVGVLTVLLALPAGRFDLGHAPLLLMFVTPQALAVALPLGWLIATLVALRRAAGGWSRIAGLRLVLAALVIGLCTLVMTAWVVPAANQQFREVVATELAVRDGRPTPVEIVPGPNELTLSEASRRIDAGVASERPPRSLDHLRFSYHVRMSLAVAPLALLLLAMGVSAMGRGRRWPILLTILGNPLSAMVFWGGVPLFAGSQPLIQAWLPVLTMAVAGAVLMLLARRGQPRMRGAS